MKPLRHKGLIWRGQSIALVRYRDLVSESLPLPDFVDWPTFPLEGSFRVKQLDDPVDVEPPRQGEDPDTCPTCALTDDAYVWVSARWRVRAPERPSGLPCVLILESRSHLDLGDLPNLLAAELGVMTVRLERAMRSLDGVARVHVYRWGDGLAHLHLWFLARPHGRLQLRGPFLTLWDRILPPVPERTWRENLALVAAWLADFGGRAMVEPPPLDWQPLTAEVAREPTEGLVGDAGSPLADVVVSATSAVAGGGPTGPGRDDGSLAEQGEVHGPSTQHTPT